MSLVIVLFALVLGWLGQGRPAHPVWVSVLALPLLWASGIWLKRRAFLVLGFLGLVALAVLCAWSGNLLGGLGVLGMALFAWDHPSWRVRGHGFLWSVGVVGTGVALGVCVSFLRFSLNFWALMAGLVLVWWVLRAWAREIHGPHGGKANGNRSASGPMR